MLRSATLSSPSKPSKPDLFSFRRRIGRAGGTFPETRLPRLLALLLLYIFIAIPASARTWRVVDARTLTEAAAGSVAGDTIELVAGAQPLRGPISLKAGLALIGSGNPVIAAGDEPAIIVSGPGVTIEGVTIDVGGVADGLAVTDVSGAFTFRRGAIRGSGRGAGVRIAGGEGEASFDAVTIERSGGPAVVIRGRRGGAIAFRGGSTIRVTGGRVDAISIEETAGTVTFADAVTITTQGARPLFAKGVGTLVVTGPVSLTSIDAAALEIHGAALDVAIARISATRSGSGYLDTGVIVSRATGRLAIAGGEIRGAKMRGLEMRHATNVSLRGLVLAANAELNGVASGPCAPASGTALRCNAAIVVEHIDGLTVEDVRIEGSGDMGISGSHVRNATFRRLEVTSAGNEIGEHAMLFRDLHGDVRFSGVTAKAAASRGLEIVNTSGEATIVVEKSSFSESAAPMGQQGIYVAAHADAKLTLRIDDVAFTKVWTFGAHVVAGGSSIVNVSVRGSRFTETGGITLIAEQNGRMTFDVGGNTLSGGSVVPINVMLIGKARASGNIDTNTITGAACNACGGIAAEAQIEGALRAKISGNTLSRIDGYAIRVTAQGASRADVDLAANTIREPLAASSPSPSAVRIQAGGKPADTAVLCARIEGNRISGGWDARGPIQIVNRTASRVRLAGYAGKSNDAAAVAAFLRPRNNGATTNVTFAQPPGKEAVTGGACQETR